MEAYVDEPEFVDTWQKIKLSNKARLAEYIKRHCRVVVDPQSMFDIQVKRIHEYKRQLLNALHLIHLYHRIIRGEAGNMAPRTAIFAGKAAPSYSRAKQIIKLITSVADVVNKDPRVRNLLKVTFLPNYNVSQAEIIMPAADLSEQISTAGTEASGTGNMKFSLNGALTIGTLDGANIEIREEVGAENIFIFGMTADEAEFERRNSSRTPELICQQNESIGNIIESIGNGSFSNGDRELFRPVVDSLMSRHDPYLLILDLEAYIACQNEVNDAFLDPATWTRKAILNVARMGKFSTDRTIKQYSEEIWGIPVQ